MMSCCCAATEKSGPPPEVVPAVPAAEDEPAPKEEPQEPPQPEPETVEPEPVIEPEPVGPEPVQEEEPVKEEEPLKEEEPVVFMCSVGGSGALGLCIDVWPESIEVLQVKPKTRCEEYNKTAPDSERLGPGQFIREVNGQTGAQAMKKELDMKKKVDLKVEIPIRREITIANSSGLGLSVKSQTSSYSLMVTGVKEGHIHSHNSAENRDEKDKILPGDYIMSVDGKNMANTMLGLLKANTPTRQITVVRLSKP
jgi:hypothetical protein